MNLFKLFMSKVYDEDGDDVECPDCGNYIIWKNDQYYCTGCEEYIDREDFFEMIEADPPGDECYSCDNCYPGCISCPYGYAEDDDV